ELPRDAVVTDACVRDEQVERPRLVDDSLDVLVVRDVADNWGSADLLGNSVDLLTRARRDRNVHARGGELARDVRADAASAARNEPPLTGELSQRLRRFRRARQGFRATRGRLDPSPARVRAPRAARSWRCASSAGPRRRRSGRA